jgi:hypothetical protein
MSTEALKSEAPINSALNSETLERAKMSSDAPVGSAMNSQTPESANSLQNANPPKTKTHYPLSFWLCFAGLCGTGLISGLDSTVLSTSLPTIIDDLEGGNNYVWVVNVYFLTW